MLVIRLARTGRRNQPKFRVAVAEHSKPVNGKVVEVVGHFNPTMKKDPLTINKEAIESWLTKGAQPSNTVSRLLNKHAGFSLEVKQRPERKPKKEAEAKPEAKPAEGESASAEDAKLPSTRDDATLTDEQSGGQAGEAGKEETAGKPAEPASSEDDSGKEPKQEEAPAKTEEPKQEETPVEPEKEEEKAEEASKDESAPADAGSDKKSE